MSTRRTSARSSARPSHAEHAAAPPTGPGRPKDLGKRAAILDAAKQMFTEHGFDGASMDQIAAAAGVSKLTVYSHFGDKATLFAAAVRAFCEQQVPASLFDAEAGLPLHDRLMAIARAFYAMITSPQAVAGHRMLCAPQIADPKLAQMFWDAGPARVHREFATLLKRRIAAGELSIDGDAAIHRAAAQFFTLLKGESHAQMVFGCDGGLCTPGIDEHLEASVGMFLRAYAPQKSRLRQ